MRFKKVKETFDLPNLSSREKSVLSSTVLRDALERYWRDIKNEAFVVLMNSSDPQRNTAIYDREVVDNIITDRQEDVLSTVLYPNGMSLSEFLEDGPKAKVPYDNDMKMKVLGRLLAAGIVRITGCGWIELIPEGVVLINHGPVDERFAHRLDIEVNGRNK